MPYSNITYDVILKRMIDRVEAWARSRNMGIDTREGSVIRTALIPAAVEIAQMYIELDSVLNESFADTASRYYLIKRAAERGLSPYPATHAVLRGEFTPNDIPLIGERFNLDKLNYVVTEKISGEVYELVCETSGIAGNQRLGQIIPIDYIQGLQTARLTELLIPAKDEESTETFRQRYFDSLNAEAFGGNIADYKQKVSALAGVGAVKVYPVWNGGGTVKLVILGADYNPPSASLVDEVQTAVDPTQNQGEGLGIAPIGHVVTVFGAGVDTVNVTLHITFETGWDWDRLKPYAENVINNYLSELAQSWGRETSLVVRVSQIETRILDLTGVLDVTDTELNGATQNLAITADNIPKSGVVTNE